MVSIIAFHSRSGMRRCIQWVNLLPRIQQRVERKEDKPCMAPCNTIQNLFRVLSLTRSSWDHAALEYLVGDRSRYFVDERGAHLRIVPQQLGHFLFLR